MLLLDSLIHPGVSIIEGGVSSAGGSASRLFIGQLACGFDEDV